MLHNYYLHIYMFTYLTQSGYSVESASLIPSRLPVLILASDWLAQSRDGSEQGSV